MMRSCIPVLWALLLVGSSGAMGESASPLAPIEQKGQQINGLTWTVRLAKEFTVFDTVEAFCGLYNSSDRQFTFDTGSPDPKRTYPQLVLSRKGGQRAVVELAPKKGFWHQYGNYKPKPGEVAHSFYVDIRLYFGSLQPGEYEFQAVYPAAAYRLKDFPGFEARDIASPLMSFRVSDTSLAAATQGQVAQQEVALVTDAPVVVDELWRIVKAGTLTNKSANAVAFRAYVADGKPGEPVSAIVATEQWNPAVGWVAIGHPGWCGTGLGVSTLKPGESARIVLEGGKPDGIYRFEVEFWKQGGDEKQTQRTYSEPVLVENFARIHLKRE